VEGPLCMGSRLRFRPRRWAICSTHWRQEAQGRPVARADSPIPPFTGPLPLLGGHLTVL